MAAIIFYEKPGCINNTKQKSLLLAAGHQLDARNLLTEPWTAERLQQFFGDLPVAQWFNRSAPLVISGAVDPERLDATKALTLMVQNPLLIRRPLMQIGDRCGVGFDPAQIAHWIALEVTEDLQHCPKKHQASSCIAIGDL